MIAEEHARGRPYRDFAMLVRANNDADPFLRALNMRGIPWTFSGNAGLYGRPEVRLLIAFLRTRGPPRRLGEPPLPGVLRRLPGARSWTSRSCATYADRKNRWLFDVLRDRRRTSCALSDGGRARRCAALVRTSSATWSWRREHPTGEVLYQFLVDSGLMTRYAKAPAELEQEVQNVSKFFTRVKDAARVLKYDNVREFVNHLDALIDAGDDPAVAEADTETPAVHVLTVHKAKGLEWPIVFMVDCVQNRFPSTRRPIRSRSRRASSRTPCPPATSTSRRSGACSTWA